MSQQYPSGGGYPYPTPPATNTGYPSGVGVNQGYPPANQGYPQVNPSQPGTGYPQTNPTYPPATAPAGQGYPQNPQVYPQNPQGYPPPSQGYPPPTQGYPPPTQGYPPPTQGNPANTQGYPQSNQGYPQAQPGYPAPTGAPIPPSSRACVTQVELTVKCRNLLDKDVTSKSDPMIAVFMKLGTTWIEKGRTENIKNCLNPEFNTKIKLDYFFEETQQIRFDVYDLDNRTPDLSDDDFLGTMECSLGQVVSSSPFSRPLLTRRGGKMRTSTITVYAEEVDSGSSEILTLLFKGKHLDNKVGMTDFLGKSDPFLEINKIGSDGSWQLAHRTHVIKNNLNPNWTAFEIKRQSLGGTNLESQVLIVCFDHDGDGSHDLIGQCTVTLAQIMEAQQHEVSWPLINLKKKQKKGKSYKDSGTLILSSCKISKSYTFLDYIFGGTQINFIIAVDFTASNGDPREPNSLHFLHPNYPNEYITAITSVGNVIKDYDSDKMFPALGFGAKIPPDMRASHEFALNFNMANPFCAGVEGLVSAYRSCLSQIQLYGPTNFSPVINHVMRFAQQAHQKPTPESYFVLLMLTDGVVTDMNETIETVVSASQLPMSIIIVGVGQADFSKMDFLDGDGGVLRSPRGRVAARDIVQFVPFNRFRQYDPSVLAKEVLAEIPQQVSQYYRMRNIPPNPPRQNVQEFT